MEIPHFKATTWRLIKSPPAPGAWNMAVDEALLYSVGIGSSAPILRLYSWAPPCLSLGYAQPFSDVNQERTTELGWEIVRRLTGGRAILHTDELTYSVIASNHEPRLKGGILESYMRLSQALLKAVIALGIPAVASPQAQTTQNNEKGQNPVCFQVPSKYEITWQGKKLLGSAQARKKEGILQHGTLPLQGDLDRILEALNLNPHYKDSQASQEKTTDLLGKATTLESILGTAPTWEEATSAFVDAFEEILNITLLDDQLTSQEKERAQTLLEEKYTNPAWTMRI